MAWRDRLYILAFYPIDEWRKAAYRIATTLFFIIVCVGGLLFHAAKADAFIGMLPGGFDFPLSEKGAELSAGMRQTIAIARALIAKPSLLLMDEPTAAMDNATEVQLVGKLQAATEGTTVVFVTHRGAMLKMADHIVVMEKGRIVMAGPRDKVLEKLKGAADGL